MKCCLPPGCQKGAATRRTTYCKYVAVGVFSSCGESPRQSLVCAPCPRTYTRICSPERRQSYKQDFNREYSEYRDLHARIDSVTRQFMELDTQLKQLHHGSHKYKVRTPTDGGLRVNVKSVSESVDEQFCYLLSCVLLLRLSCPFCLVKLLIRDVLLFSILFRFFAFSDGS